MSAFICSDRQFAVVARQLFLTEAQQQRFADALKRENIRSVNYRYKETTRFTPVKLSEADGAPNYNDLDLIKLLTCIDYQSCERPDYDDTRIAVAIMALAGRNRVNRQAEENLWAI